MLKYVSKCVFHVPSVPEISVLEEEHKTDLQALGLNELLAVQPCFCMDDLKKIATRKVLFYSADLLVLDTARKMHELRESNLLLSLFVDRATALESVNTGSGPELLSLKEVVSTIWQPSVRDFHMLGVRIAQGFVTFKEVDKVVDGCGDEGGGTKIKKELHLMDRVNEAHEGLEKDWAELRLSQIQEYRQLHCAAGAANAILKIRDRLGLRGDFSHIYSLTELVQEI